VRSDDWKLTCRATDFLPPADLLAAVEVEEADLAQLGPGCLAPFTQKDEGEVLLDGR